MRKQRTIRYRPAVQRASRQPENVRVTTQRSLFAEMVARLSAEDPARAQAFLALLRQATKSGSPRAIVDVITAFSNFGTSIAEAARPTPLRVRPASLADSWNAVGRSIGAGMIEYGERHDRHVR